MATQISGRRDDSPEGSSFTRLSSGERLEDIVRPRHWARVRGAVTWALIDHARAARRMADGIRDVAPHPSRTEALMQEDRGRQVRVFARQLPHVQPVAIGCDEGRARALVHHALRELSPERHRWTLSNGHGGAINMPFLVTAAIRVWQA